MRDDGLTHLDSEGRPRMVDVTGKDATRRAATAEGHIVVSADALRRLQEGRTPKGDPLVVAELAGVMGAKRTPDLIPLCHALAGLSAEVRAVVDADLPGVRVRATTRTAGPTGVEMEALTAVAVALLAVYDMLKAVDRGMRIGGIRLLTKEGGASGRWSAGGDADTPAGPGDARGRPQGDGSAADAGS